MFLTKKHISRRTVLKGAGVSLALPLLDAMIPAYTALADTAAAPGRLRTGFFYLPHGAIMGNTGHGPELDHWTPSGSGTNFQLSRILAPLEAFKSQLVSFTNLDNPVGSSVHTLNPATWLSGVRPGGGGSANMSVTLDQLIAQRLGQETPLPSLELAAETTIQHAACQGGQGCLYSSTLSYRNATTPLPMEYNPRRVFLRLFGDPSNAELQAAQTRQTASILDHIQDRTHALQRRLGPGDRIVLDGYLETVRELERRVAQSVSGDARDLSALNLPDMPIGELDSFDEQVRIMFDLLALAYQADLTRVASYIMSSEGTTRTYNHIGVSGGFHPISHHANNLDRIEELTKIQHYHVERFADFLAKLAATPDGDGTLLDHSLFLFGSNMSNSDYHDSYPLPNILVGGADGLIRGGQHVELPRTRLANLHLTILNKLGFDRSSFGDSTGEILEI